MAASVTFFSSVTRHFARTATSARNFAGGNAALETLQEKTEKTTPLLLRAFLDRASNISVLRRLVANTARVHERACTQKLTHKVEASTHTGTQDRTHTHTHTHLHTGACTCPSTQQHAYVQPC